MNRQKLLGHVGQMRRLRPLPRNTTGEEIDDFWDVVSADSTGLTLRNRRTNDELCLGYDHIHEYRTPDFLILKSVVHMSVLGAQLEPIVSPPKVTLVVATPLPAPERKADGLWSAEVHVHPSRVENVPEATVEVLFDRPYRTGTYKVVPNGTQALMIRELFGIEGAENSNRFRMGLVELPRDTWLRLSFCGETPPVPKKIILTPYFKYI